MIFTTVGTHKLGFNRLIEEIDKLCIGNDYFCNDIILQRGHSIPSSFVHHQFDFIPQVEINNFIIDSTVVITHAGVGSVMAALQLGKAVIACPRYFSLGEHVDDHQIEWCNEIERLGWVLALRQGGSLIDLVQRSKYFKSTYIKKSDLQLFFQNNIF